MFTKMTISISLNKYTAFVSYAKAISICMCVCVCKMLSRVENSL